MKLRTSALRHENLSVQIKSRLERHLLLKSKLRIDSRENHNACGRSQNRSTNWFCFDLSSQPYFELVLAYTHQFVEMTAVDLHHFPFIPQTSNVVLEVQLNTQLRRRRDGQSGRITIHQPVLDLRRLCAVHFKATRINHKGSQVKPTVKGQKNHPIFGAGRFLSTIKPSLAVFQIHKHLQLLPEMLHSLSRVRWAWWILRTYSAEIW